MPASASRSRCLCRETASCAVSGVTGCGSAEPLRRSAPRSRPRGRVPGRDRRRRPPRRARGARSPARPRSRRSRGGRRSGSRAPRGRGRPRRRSARRARAAASTPSCAGPAPRTSKRATPAIVAEGPDHRGKVRARVSGFAGSRVLGCWCVLGVALLAVAGVAYLLGYRGGDTSPVTPHDDVAPTTRRRPRRRLPWASCSRAQAPWTCRRTRRRSPGRRPSLRRAGCAGGLRGPSPVLWDSAEASGTQHVVRLTGLASSTTYHVSLVATSAGGQDIARTELSGSRRRRRADAGAGRRARRRAARERRAVLPAARVAAVPRTCGREASRRASTCSPSAAPARARPGRAVGARGARARRRSRQQPATSETGFSARSTPTRRTPAG